LTGYFYTLMNLAIDIGNSRIKWARFEGQKVVESGMTPESNVNELRGLMSFHQNDDITISTVVKLQTEFLAFCKEKNAMLIDSSTQIPITNNYSTPKTLGIDRLCAAIGAKSLFPENPVLSIDIGTCIKYEFITANSEYQGGNISPGLQMRFCFDSTITLLNYRH